MESSNALKDKKAELQKDNFIFQDAIHLAIETAEATGGIFPSEEHYALLYENGYIAYPPEEIQRIFYDWEDYRQIAQSYYTDFLGERTEKERRIFETIHQERNSGVLPHLLFKAKESYHEVDHLGQPIKRGLNVRYHLTKNDASPDIQLERYAKYKVLEYLLKNYEGKGIPEENKLNIVLGFTQSTGKAKTSYIGAIQSGRPNISKADIENAAELLGLYEYVFPRTRREYLNELLKTMQWPKKNRASKKISSKGYLVEPLPSKKPELYYDLSTGRVIIGKLAIDRYLEDSGGYTSDIYELRQLLMSDQKFPNRASNNPNISKLPDQHFLDYGAFLVNLVGKENINGVLIARAAQAGLGVGVASIKNRFGSLNDFFNLLDIRKNMPKNIFASWSYEDRVNYIKSVAQINGGQISERILIKHAAIERSHGRWAPNIKVVTDNNNYKLSQIIADAGLKSAPNHTPHTEQFIEAGIIFFGIHKRLPTKKDFSTNGLPSTNSAHRLFGGIKKYQETLLSRIDSST